MTVDLRIASTVNMFVRLVLLFVCKANFDIATETVSVCVCLTLASDSLETVEVTIVKLITVTASVTRMHHMLIRLTVTFIQGHSDLNHENNICLVISKTIQAMTIKFAVNIVRLWSQKHLKLDYCLTSQTICKLLHSNLA